MNNSIKEKKIPSNATQNLIASENTHQSSLKVQLYILTFQIHHSIPWNRLSTKVSQMH